MNAIRSPALLVTLAVGWHVVFVVSIFDIHYRSPLVHGMAAQRCVAEGAASRMVLFVVDGMRADAFFQVNPDTGKVRRFFFFVLRLLTGRGY